MKKLIKYLIIRMMSKDTDTALKVFNTLTSQDTIEKKKEVVLPKRKEITEKKNKKQELLDSLNYLKGKKLKTKQDKESIYTLEMVLKGMK